MRRRKELLREIDRTKCKLRQDLDPQVYAMYRSYLCGLEWALMDSRDSHKEELSQSGINLGIYIP
jgi:hypothetical protein